MKTALRTLVPALVLLSAGCGGEAAPTPPEDPDAVVLTVTSEGGFVPVELQIDRTPRYVLTADGRLFSPGVVPMIFPGPLMTPVQVTTVSDEVMAEVMTLVEEVGLPDIDDRTDNEAAQFVADATTDVVTYFDGNGAHRYAVYALGFPEASSSVEAVLLADIVEVLDAANAEAPGQPYEGDRLQVIAGIPGIEQGEPVPATVEPWPLDTAFSDMPELLLEWRCTVVENAAAEGLGEVFSAADQAHRWDWEGEELTIRARYLLPGEEPCVPPAAVA